MRLTSKHSTHSRTTVEIKHFIKNTSKILSDCESFSAETANLKCFYLPAKGILRLFLALKKSITLDDEGNSSL